MTVDVHTLAYLTETPYNQARHEVLGDYPWLQYLRRIAENPRLFAVRHKDTGRFSVCVWVFSPEESGTPVFSELEGFHGDPRSMWPEGLMSPEVCKRRFRPYEEHAAASEARARDRSSAKITQELQVRERQRDYAKILRRRGMFQTAKLMEEGRLPVSTNEEARGRWLEEFKGAGKTVALVDGGRPVASPGRA